MLPSLPSLIENLPLFAQAMDPSTQESVFSRLLDIPPPFNMVVLIVAFGCGASVIKGVVKQVRIFADNEADRRLKREMIESGLAVDEAERIAAMPIKHASPTA